MEEKMKKFLLFLCAVLIVLCFSGLASATPVTLSIFSQPGMEVYGPATSYLEPGATGWSSLGPGSAQAAWVHPSWPGISGADWISTAEYVEDPVNDSWRWFHVEFFIPSGVEILSAGVTMVTADNAERLWLNDDVIGGDGEVEGAFTDDHEWGTIKTYAMDPLVGEINDLDFIVRNYALPGGTVTSNPTGLIFKAEVEYAPVPEPATMLLLGSGLIGLAGLGRKKFFKKKS
jgi:hypothetical protein